MLRLHIPLIKPDVRISRIRLSDKVSRVRSREVTLDPAQADQADWLRLRIMFEEQLKTLGASGTGKE